MNRSIGLVVLASLTVAVGCTDHGDLNAPEVVSCVGDCPYGECDSHCSKWTDGGCTSPGACLVAYGCVKTSPQTCNSIGTDLARYPQACASPNGAYCATEVGTGGARLVFAATCVDGGVTLTDCTAASYCADGGAVSPVCRGACGPKYCVH